MSGRAVLGEPPATPSSGRGTLGDEPWMARALELAQLGWGQVSPNPLVGAVVVNDGVVVGEGAHRRFGAAHAEVEALQAAGERARRATLYATLEPCAHHGKTPPCVDAIIRAGVSRVVVAVRDPNPQAGGGIEQLRAAGVRVDVGVLAEEATELNAPFLHAFRSDRPWVTLKLAVSLDGAIAQASRTTSWLTGPESRRRVHHLRAGSDAIAVGMGTVLADDPLLTVRDADPPRVAPTRVIFSRTGRLPLTSRMAQRSHEAPVIVFASALDPSYEHSLRSLGVEAIAASSLMEALQILRARGIQSLLAEGGASLTASLLEHDVVDRLVLFQAPIVLGEGSLSAFGSFSSTFGADGLRFRPLRSEQIGDDHMIVLAPAGR
ncbi:MAG TPA: bifunctional diaminohydroxyphosphoribosylaminopyrimidine deaminase/5-amino-6-(5-phosphoribosylamino)uracil reductase RibD [Gemmatimonadaceae bacterium]